MVTPQGRLLDLNQTEEMFRQLRGKREGMRIATREHAVISQQKEEVTIQYRELQMMDGTDQTRLSLALLDCSTSIPRWRFLQEMLVA
nr:Glutamine--tRNA ligase [Candidatus Pantoea persica]